MANPEPEYVSKWPEGSIGWAIEMVALGHAVRRTGEWPATRGMILLNGRSLAEPFSTLEDFDGLPMTTDLFFATDWEIVHPKTVMEILWFSRR